MTDEERLLALSLLVSDGTHVDWARVEREAPEDLLEAVRRLRALSQIAVQSGGVEGHAGTDGGNDSCGQWGHLRLLEVVGRGAYGEVYRAFDTRLEREVALKLLYPDPPGAPTRASALVREARLLARVRHTNVVTVFDSESRAGRVGLWMEFVRGRTLARLIEDQGALGPREAALVGLDLCRALAAIHAVELVHRDLKAQNVMREVGGRIVLMDFGAGLDVRRPGIASLDAVSGTPLYMAPEVLAGDPPTPRADLYSLGVLLYHLVTDSYPVTATSVAALREAHARGEARLLRDVRPDLPEAFVLAVERALAPFEKRYVSAGAMETALSRYLFLSAAASGVQTAPETRRGGGRGGALVAGVCLAAGAGLAALYVLRSPAPEAGSSAGTASPSAIGAAPPGTAPSRVREPTPPPGSAAYDLDAGLYLSTQDGRRRLESGARLAPGDRLFLELETSRPLHFYVLSEDERGECHLLFPLPGRRPENPLPAGHHRLPGPADGRELFWQVTSAGGREHLLLLASPEGLGAVESEIRKLPPPDFERQMALALPRDAADRLRGIGGLAPAPESTPGAGTPGAAPSLFQIARRLGTGQERVRGLWIRRIVLDNPASS